MWIWILPLILLVILEATADYFAGSFGHGSKMYYAFIAMAFYILANISWLFAIKNGSGLTRGASLFSVFSMVLAVAIGIFIYKESITNTQIIGVILGVIAIILVLE